MLLSVFADNDCALPRRDCIVLDTRMERGWRLAGRWWALGHGAVAVGGVCEVPTALPTMVGLGTATPIGAIATQKDPPPHLMLVARCLRRPHAIVTAYAAAQASIPVARALHSSPLLRALDMAKVDTTERLAALRTLMRERNVDIYSTVAADRERAPNSLTRRSGPVRRQPSERVHCAL